MYWLVVLVLSQQSAQLDFNILFVDLDYRLGFFMGFLMVCQIKNAELTNQSQWLLGHDDVIATWYDLILSRCLK